MRGSSKKIVRMHWARGGASIRHQLLGGEDERHLVRRSCRASRCRFTSVVTCGYDRTSQSFS